MNREEEWERMVQSSDTYVMSDQEVKLTGRIATRQVNAKQHELVEVTPVNAEDGTWKKWVQLAALFKVQK